MAKENAQAPESGNGQETRNAGARMMHIRVNRPHGSKEDAMYIGVNGKTWLVRYDEDVYVPETVYYHIMQSLRAEKTRDAHIERL